MKRSRYMVPLLLLCALTVYAYISYYSQESILDRVVQRNGYELYQRQQSVPFEFYLDPDWLPKTSEEVEYHIQLGSLHNTDIILDRIISRDKSIYIGLKAVPHMKIFLGSFLYIWDIKDNNTSSSYDPIDEWQLLDKNRLPLQQFTMNYGTGEGPGNTFGIEIDKKYMELLQQGLYFKFSGFILYEYWKK
ncbi:hypothetical protein FE783_12280 [Paenibacillus mesophilus]|uniref:hypothetical protein n=1 Tax=Paenibacillus mesophilus TaxID=2582849 RepID=UPI00110DDE61|nr:hypothetical protein [Paenibacillus mesophilus]TMV50322.1 hypothetical protein FE783_12280 [Paenibacillus mesophilus]